MNTLRTIETEADFASQVELPVLRKGFASGRRAEFWRQSLVNAILLVSDVLLAVLICEVAFGIQSIWGQDQISGTTIIGVVPSVVAWIAFRTLMGLYPGYGLDQAEELRRQVYALAATLSTIIILAVVIQAVSFVSRLALFSGFLGLLLFAPLGRQLVKWLLMKAGLWGKPVVIFGSGLFGERVATVLNEEWTLGYRPVAVFRNQPATDKRSKYEETPDEKSLATATMLAQKRGVDMVIFAMPHTRHKCLAELVHWASHGFRHVTVMPNLEGITNSMVVARDFAGIFGVEIRHNLLNPSVLRAKRAMDIVATVLGGIFALPLIAVLALLVWLESGGPVFYSAKRMGRDNRLFACVKFRTMVPDGEAVLQRMLEEDPDLYEEYATYHKLRDDPRVTRVGRFLRMTSLDELPQLWNVLLGQMSLVGPRPYLPRESEEIGTMQSEILRVYPGITGPWQVSGRNDVSFFDRVRTDSYYVRNWSIWLDMVILVRTVWAVIRQRGH